MGADPCRPRRCGAFTQSLAVLGVDGPRLVSAGSEKARTRSVLPLPLAERRGWWVQDCRLQGATEHRKGRFSEWGQSRILFQISLIFLAGLETHW